MVNVSETLETGQRILPALTPFPKPEVRALAIIVGFIVIWTALATAAGMIHPDTSTQGFSTASNYFSYAARNGGIFLFFFCAIAFMRFTHNSGDVPIMQAVKDHYGAHKDVYIKAPARVVIALATFGTFIFSYSKIKTRIPEFAAYKWDVAFADMDRFIFFGRDPWTVFAWLYDMPTLIRAMDFIYDAWAAILVGTWTLCFVLAKHAVKVRFRFPLALMLTWFIGGNITAILLSSAGPCYFAQVTGLPDIYAAQMAQLSALDSVQSMRAVQYQAMLWDVYQSPSVGLGGISAMPSMHCATSFLLVLLAWKHRIWRALAIGFFIFILITSFVLAWHYAVDGLLAMPIALFGWWAAKIILNTTAGPKS